MAERKNEHNQQQQSESSDLKEREYRDEEGNVHHHTRTYMEQHKGENKGGGSGRDESERSSRDEEE